MTNNLSKIKELPFVSICTVTFNRRPFFEYLIKSILQQTYQGKIEWIIIDDGTDKVKDLVSHLDFVKYYECNEKMTISKKRNLSNSLSTGDYIIYFDDDDYYPPQRIEHAVELLEKNPEYLIAGCNTMFIYYKDKKLMYSFGPYGKYHSTAATFAFRRDLLEITEFNENDCLSEEKFFLKNYTIPLIQLNPLLSILVFRHIHNSFDKNELLNPNINSLSCLREDVKVEDFIKDNELKIFYSEEIDNYLLPYKCGEIKNKPDILNHIKITNEKRKQQSLIYNKKKEDDNDSKKSEKMYDKEYVDNLIKKYEDMIEKKSILIQNLLLKIKSLNENKQSIDLNFVVERNMKK